MSGKQLFRTGILEASTDQKEELGVLRHEEDRTNNQGVKTYRYVQYAGASLGGNISKGEVVYYLGSTPYLVTADVSDAGADGHTVAGVATTNVATNQYCWLQTGGFCNQINITGSVQAGSALVATSDGVATSMTINDQTVFAFALASDTPDTICAAAFLRITE